MELNKNYPWLTPLEVSNQLIQDWQNKETTKSLTFWALRNKKIDQKTYFDWAINHYQIPFLNGLFFEQNLMTKTQWNEIKDLFDWTEEILPVAFWNNTIFIGCVEPPKKELKILDFETRYVLTSYWSLRVMWKFVQSLSHFIEKENTKSIAFDKLNKELEKLSIEELDKPVNAKPMMSKQAISPMTPTEKPLDKPVNAEPMMSKQAISPMTPTEKPLDKPVNAEPMMSKQAISPMTPTEKPLDKPVNAEPMMSKQAISPMTPTEKPLDKPVNAEPMMSKQASSLPEVEEERVVEDNNIFPDRSPSDDNVLLMNNFKKDNKQKVSENLSDNAVTEVTKFTLVDKDKTLTHVSVSYNYEELWKYTKSFYCTSLVLKVKGEKIYPISWTGKIKCSKTEEVFVDLNDYSLFKIVKKGYSYNGFVVDNPVNKKFFSQIGWQEYPKHVTAIPVKDSQNNLVNVFVGLSIESISRGKIQQIEENVLKFFQTAYGLSQAA